MAVFALKDKGFDGRITSEINRKGAIMSKYNVLWEYVKNNGNPSFRLTFDEIQNIAGLPIDHSFLTYKKELVEYGYEVGKISIKNQAVDFHKLDV